MSEFLPTNISPIGKISWDGEVWCSDEEFWSPFSETKVHFMGDWLSRDGLESVNANITNFLNLSIADREKVKPHLIEYRGAMSEILDDDCTKPNLDADIWSEISFGQEIWINSVPGKQNSFYSSLSCGVIWDQEHGLELNFLNGNELVKLGQCDGSFVHSRTSNLESDEKAILPPYILRHLRLKRYKQAAAAQNQTSEKNKQKRSWISWLKN